jgi:uncharacterized membrane protein YphA (DoxX/SURF4 family)
MTLRNLALRVATGAYILHAGIEKRGWGPEQATGIHGMAAGAYPVLKPVPAEKFLRALSVTETALGLALLAPFVPTAVAGAGLTGFAGGLVTMYLRTPALRRPGSIWPSQNGVAISKDSWMLGIGLALLADATAQHRASR